VSKPNPPANYGSCWVEWTIEQLTELPMMSRQEAIAQIRLSLDGDGFPEIDGKQRSIAIAYLDGLIRGSRP
jgi:hypothetical protein